MLLNILKTTWPVVLASMAVLALSAVADAQITLTPWPDSSDTLGGEPLHETCDLDTVHLQSSFPDIRVFATDTVEQSEMSIAVNPGNPSELLIGCNVNWKSTWQSADDWQYNQGFYFSDDTGSTWTGSNFLAPPEFWWEERPIYMNTDPAVGFDDVGTPFFNHMHYDIDTSVPSEGYVIVATKYIAGEWSEYEFVPGTVSPDKNHWAMDVSGASSYTGEGYTAYMAPEPFEPKKNVLSVYDSDGDTFKTPIVITGSTGAFATQGVNLIVGQDGDIYAAWATYDSFFTNSNPRAEDGLGFVHIAAGGGSLVDTARVILEIDGLRGFIKKTCTPAPEGIRLNGFPSMALDTSGGSFDGTLYIVWGDSRYGSPDILLSKSMDEGVTWSTPVRVNDDMTCTDQWLPWMTVDPDGNVHIVFYDSRVDTADNCLAAVYMATSTDGGCTFFNRLVSDVAFTPDPQDGTALAYMGDYIGIAANSEYVFPCWSDNRTNCRQQAYIARVPVDSAISFPQISGTLSGNTEWSSIVGLGGDVTVGVNDTLIIAPSAIVVAAADQDSENSGVDTTLIELIVLGTLIIEDTSEAAGSCAPADRAYLRGSSGSAGSWYGLRLLAGSKLVLEQELQIEDALVGLTIDSAGTIDTLSGISIVNFESVGLQIAGEGLVVHSDTLIGSGQGRGISIAGVNATIEMCIIKETDVGIQTTNSSSTIDGVVIEDVDNDGIQIWVGGHATITDVTITGAAGDGISLNAADTSVQTVIDGCVISDVGGGISVFSSAAAISNTRIENADYGISVVLGKNVSLIEDTIIDCTGGAGISINGCDATVQDCVVENCSYGIYLLGSGGTLKGNLILGPGSYGIYVAKDPEGFGEDTVTIVNDSVAGYFTYALLNAATKGHCRIDTCQFIADTNASGEFPPYGVKALSSAWVKIRHSKIVDYSTAGFYSFMSSANLGEMPDTGFNSIYVTGGPVNCVPQSAIHIEFGGFGPGPPILPTLKAEGNWWGTDPLSDPEACWFTLIDYTPWLDDDPLAKRVEHFVAQTGVPEEFSLSQNFPNPFNPSTVIEFSLPKPSQTRVEIFNILGQRVRELAHRYFAAGRHQLTWNGRDSRGKSLASGVYLYRIVADGQVETRKMVLLK